VSEGLDSFDLEYKWINQKGGIKDFPPWVSLHLIRIAIRSLVDAHPNLSGRVGAVKENCLVCRRSALTKKWTCSHGSLCFVVVSLTHSFWLRRLFLLRKDPVAWCYVALFVVGGGSLLLLCRCSFSTNHIHSPPSCHRFLVSHNPSFIWMVLNQSHGVYLTPTVFWCQLIGGWLMSWPFFQIPPFRAVISLLLVDSNVCLTGIRRSRPIRVAHAWITTVFSGKEVRLPLAWISTFGGVCSC
jgi:hypothetical protein